MMVSVVFGANSDNVDILAQATTTRVDGAKFALKRNEAKKVKCGWYSTWYYNYYLNPYSNIYSGTSKSWIYAQFWWFGR